MPEVRNRHTSSHHSLRPACPRRAGRGACNFCNHQAPTDGILRRTQRLPETAGIASGDGCQRTSYQRSAVRQEIVTGCCPLADPLSATAKDILLSRSPGCVRSERPTIRPAAPDRRREVGRIRPPASDSQRCEQDGSDCESSTSRSNAQL